MRAARAAAAQAYFRAHAAEWDRIRKLHVADEAVEDAIRSALACLLYTSRIKISLYSGNTPIFVSVMPSMSDQPQLGQPQLGFDALNAALKAAGEETRLRVLALLGEAELTVSDLTDILRQSQPRISRHLKLLAEAGLIERFREGTWAFFRLSEHGGGAEVARSLLALSLIHISGVPRPALCAMMDSSSAEAERLTFFNPKTPAAPASLWAQDCKPSGIGEVSCRPCKVARLSLIHISRRDIRARFRDRARG